MKKLVLLMAMTGLTAACADRGVVGVVADRTAPAAGSTGIRVMTWNVYYGTDPTPLLTADPNDVPFVAAQVWGLAQQTNFPARAGALARQIAANQPHLVGVEEAALWRIQHPGDAAFGGTVPATDVVYDFLQLLVDSLGARGAHYIIAAADSTTDVEVPVFTGIDGEGNPTFDDVRLTDRDAVLARADVPIANPQHAKFQAYVPLQIGGFQTGLYEGWSSVEATVGGQTYRFVATHLEAQPFMPVPVFQAQELLALLQDETRPTILAGDFNSDVYGKVPEAATPSYGMMIDAGFSDTWTRFSQSPPGLTCCQRGDLLNAKSLFDQRLDFIFTRNMPQGAPAGSLTLARMVVGNQPGDRTASGLWPSDHGGVVASFLSPPPVAGPAIATH